VHQVGNLNKLYYDARSEKHKIKHFSARFFYFREIFITFPPFKNYGFQLCLQENNKLISNVVVSASVIMNEGMPDEMRHELAREFYRLMKEG
jgi:hypothetical protein